MKGTKPDLVLLSCVFGLLVFGWVMVYSSSALVAEMRYHDQFLLSEAPDHLVGDRNGGLFWCRRKFRCRFWQKKLAQTSMRSFSFRFCSCW